MLFHYIDLGKNIIFNYLVIFCWIFKRGSKWQLFLFKNYCPAL